MLQILVLAFCIPILDFLFLGVIAKEIYFQNLLPFARLKSGGDGIDVNYVAAGAVYILMIFGIYFFVLKQTIQLTTVLEVFVQGFLFGLVLYGVYEFTNLSFIKDWPVPIVFIDTLWGATLMGISAAVAHAVSLKIGS